MKAFTFEQLALILLVIVGLSFALILTTSQFRTLGNALGIFGSQANSSASTATSVVGEGSCDIAGGFCASTCNSFVSDANQELGCASGSKCCLS